MEAVAAVDDGDGDREVPSEGRADPEAFGGVVGGVESAGDFLLLEQSGLIDGKSGVDAGDVVLVDRGWRDERLIAVAEDIGGEDAVDVRGGRVGGLGEGDLDRWFEGKNPGLTSESWGTQIGGWGTRLVDKTKDFEGGQAELAAGGDGEGVEEVEVLEREIGIEREQLDPVVAARRGDGRGDDTEVLARVVGADVEEAARLWRKAMVRVVLLLVEARRDEAEFGRWGRRRGGSGTRWWCGCRTRSGGRGRRGCGRH